MTGVAPFASVAPRAVLGRDTLLLFWNPGCGFCLSMHEDLLTWERSTNGHTPADGRIASEVVAGAEAVLELANGRA